MNRTKILYDYLISQTQENKRCDTLFFQPFNRPGQIEPKYQWRPGRNYGRMETLPPLFHYLKSVLLLSKKGLTFSLKSFRIALFSLPIYPIASALGDDRAMKARQFMAAVCRNSNNKFTSASQSPLGIC